MKVRLPVPERADGLTVVITGASSGIGRAAARELGALGATVAVVGRNRARTEATAEEVGGRAYLADFADLANVRTLADQLLADLPQIHVLANNAGGMFPREDSADGFGLTFQLNHLAGFLLAGLLRDRMVETAKDAAPGTVRIIHTSSVAARSGKIELTDLDNRRGPWLAGWRAYSAAKLENIVTTRELARRLQRTGVSAYAFHPGWVATSFGADQPFVSLASSRFALSPEQGAQPLVRLASTHRVPVPSGNVFDRLVAPMRVPAQANDTKLGRALWQVSERRTGLA